MKKHLIYLLVVLFSGGNLSGQAPEWVWQTNYGDKNSNPICATSDKNNNYYLAGVFFVKSLQIGDKILTKYNTNPTGFRPDFFVIKFDPNGNIVWVEGGNPDFFGNPCNIAVADDGSVYVSGEFSKNVFLIKISPSGNIVRTFHHFSANTQLIPADIDISKTGDIYLSAFFNGDTLLIKDKVFYRPDSLKSYYGKVLLKMDADGNIIWHRYFLEYIGSFDPVRYKEFKLLALNDKEEIYSLVGHPIYNNAVDKDTLENPQNELACLLKFDKNGEIMQYRFLGGPVAFYPFALNLDAESNVYISGNLCNDKLQVDSVILKKKYYHNSAFLIKLNSNLVAEWGVLGNGKDQIYYDDAATDQFGNTSFLIFSCFPEFFFNEQLIIDTSAGYISAIYTFNKKGHLISSKAVNDIITNSQVNNYYYNRQLLFNSNNDLLLTTDKFIGKLGTAIVRINEQPDIENEIHFYPNPLSDGTLYFSISDPSKISELRILDINGQIIRQFQINSLNGNSVELRNLPAGIYFIHVTGEDYIKVQKIIVR